MRTKCSEKPSGSRYEMSETTVGSQVNAKSSSEYCSLQKPVDLSMCKAASATITGMNVTFMRRILYGASPKFLKRGTTGDALGRFFKFIGRDLSVGG